MFGSIVDYFNTPKSEEKIENFDEDQEVEELERSFFDLGFGTALNDPVGLAEMDLTGSLLDKSEIFETKTGEPELTKEQKEEITQLIHQIVQIRYAGLLSHVKNGFPL